MVAPEAGKRIVPFAKEIVVGSRTMQFGVWLPSFTRADDTWGSARALREWCIRADHAGIDIWIIDHLLVAPGLYATSWLEPLELLTFAAARTQRVLPNQPPAHSVPPLAAPRPFARHET